MNLKQLFELQMNLDLHIEGEHPRRENEARFPKKKLALLVEIGELANELPEVFKFWSHKKNNHDKALGELVDCLHFILSIGLEINYDYELLDFHYPKFNDVTEDDLLEEFDSFFFYAVKVDKKEWYYELFNSFLILSSFIGFSWEQIEDGYYQKNKINHFRQAQGY